MGSDLNTEVAALVSKIAGARRQEVTPEATLFGDLGVDGDDAVELFEEFAKTFRVDLTGFRIDRYFGPEGGGDPFTAILDVIHFLRVRDWHKVAGVEPLTVRDLVEAAGRGRWHKA